MWEKGTFARDGILTGKVTHTYRDVHPPSPITPKDRRIMGAEIQACATRHGTPLPVNLLGSGISDAELGRWMGHTVTVQETELQRGHPLLLPAPQVSLQFNSPAPLQNRATSMIHSLSPHCGPTTGPQMSPDPLGVLVLFPVSPRGPRKRHEYPSLCYT